MGLRFAKAYREHDKLRKSFFRLAWETFGLDFAPWYQGGWWTDHYIPYSFIDGEEVVANVSVNRMELERAGSRHRGIQVGTVMTRPEYRGRGLCRRLLESVLEEWRDRCDILYLLANDSVLDLYPKFGFRPAEEPLHSGPLHRTPGPLRPLDLSEEGDRKLLLDCYRASNPSSALASVGDPGLLMFYCGGAGRGHPALSRPAWRGCRPGAGRASGRAGNRAGDLGLHAQGPRRNAAGTASGGGYHPVPSGGDGGVVPPGGPAPARPLPYLSR